MPKWLSLINGEIHPHSNEKLISHSLFSTLVESQQLLEITQRDIEKQLAETELECERLKGVAREEGYQEGLTQLIKAILDLDEEKKHLYHRVNEMVIHLALNAAKKIVAKELEVKPETITDIVLQVVTPAIQSNSVTIYINKADKEALEGEKGRLKERLESVRTLSIKERDDITPGGCIIQTESGIINASWENLWNAIEKAWNRCRKQE